MSSKRLGDSSALVNENLNQLFLLKMKNTLDVALKIFPALASQFDDLLRQFQAWKDKKQVTLFTLSKICNHLEEILKLADNLSFFNTINFNSFAAFNPSGPCELKEH